MLGNNIEGRDGGFTLRQQKSTQTYPAILPPLRILSYDVRHY
jgi:hypothetical protein